MTAKVYNEDLVAAFGSKEIYCTFNKNHEDPNPESTNIGQESE